MLARYARFFLVLFTTIVFVAFSIANRELVALDFFPIPYTADMPVFIFAIICFSLGIVVAGLLMSLKLARSNHRFHKAQKRANALENELKGVRSEQQALLAVTARKQA